MTRASDTKVDEACLALVTNPILCRVLRPLSRATAAAARFLTGRFAFVATPVAANRSGWTCSRRAFFLSVGWPDGTARFGRALPLATPRRGFTPLATPPPALRSCSLEALAALVPLPTGSRTGGLRLASFPFGSGRLAPLPFGFGRLAFAGRGAVARGSRVSAGWARGPGSRPAKVLRVARLLPATAFLVALALPATALRVARAPPSTTFLVARAPPVTMLHAARAPPANASLVARAPPATALPAVLPRSAKARPAAPPT